MRGVWLAPLVVLLLCAGTAWAGPDGDGQGYSLRVPTGFKALTFEDMQICPVHRVDLTAKIAAPSAETRRVYGIGTILEPDALLLVARVDLNTDALGSSRARHRYMLDRLFLSESRFATLVSEGEVELRPMEIGGHEALHLSHAGVEGPLGLEEPATRALLVVSDDCLVLVMLQVRDPAAISVDATWSTIRGGFVMDAPLRPIRQALLYGGMGLAGLLLLVVFARLVGRGRPVRAAAHAPRGGLALSSEGWGGGRSTEVGPPPIETPAAPPADPCEAAPRERVVPREVPAPAAAEAVAAAPIQSSRLPSSAPAGPPPRKGLQSTRPANGRFTQ